MSILKVKLLHPVAKLPVKSFESDAGFDLHAIGNYTLNPHCGDIIEEDRIWNHDGQVEIPIGIALEIPEGYYGHIFSRSGLSKIGLRAHQGVIDSGYRGPIGVMLWNAGKEIIKIFSGDRIAQLLILPVPQIEVQEVLEVSPSARGIHGFGSTGK